MSGYHLFSNANIVTMDSSCPTAEAFLTFQDRFVAVGTTQEVRKQAPANAQMIDLKGRTVIPGLIETHNHLSYYCLTLSMVDCSAYSNKRMDEVKARLKKSAEALLANEWLVGWGYDDTMHADTRHLHRHDLDVVAPANPVFISHASGHIVYTNSVGLRMGGITKETPQPPGGSFDVDGDGEPTGVLREPGAIWLVACHLPVPDRSTFQTVLPAAAAAYNRQGITSTHDGAVGMFGYGIPTLRAYQNLAAANQLTVRVYLTTHHDFYDSLLAAGITRGFGSDYLRVGAVKMFQDGSIQGLTAALNDDYHCQSGFRGHLIRPQEEMDALVSRFHRQGLQIACHANGDAAIESVILAIERAQKDYPQPVLRHMIIHCQMATRGHITRMKTLGIVPSYFPNHVYYWGDRHASRFIGPQRAACINPLASSVKAGLRFTLHADTPVTPICPLHSMHCAVNRITANGELLGADECITPHAALKAFTVDAAYCSYEEGIKGAVTPGMLADFAVLSDNPLTVAPRTIKDIQVLATYVGGQAVYRADRDANRQPLR
jgi:predicted amidohydrolase YtcJ